MTQLRSYDSAEIHQLAPMPDAIRALRDCFADAPTHIARTPVPAAGGEFMLMPAVDGGAAGIKLLMIQPANASRGQPVIQGTYVLFDAEAGRPVALLDGAALTNIRTPAVSAIATDVLARPDARTLGIVGSGPQAFAHVVAMLAVRPAVEQIIVASRTEAHAEALVARLAALEGPAGGRHVRAAHVADAAGADIVCVATRSSTPVVDSSMVRSGAHVNAVGSYRTDIRELAPDLVAASTVYVDEIHAAHDEAGDLELAAQDGLWSWDRLAGDLTDLSSGRATRHSADEITLFKSVGLAVEDLVIARLVASKSQGRSGGAVER